MNADRDRGRQSPAGSRRAARWEARTAPRGRSARRPGGRRTAGPTAGESSDDGAAPSREPRRVLAGAGSALQHQQGHVVPRPARPEPEHRLGRCASAMRSAGSPACPAGSRPAGVLPEQLRAAAAFDDAVRVERRRCRRERASTAPAPRRPGLGQHADQRAGRRRSARPSRPDAPRAAAAGGRRRSRFSSGVARSESEHRVHDRAELRPRPLHQHGVVQSDDHVGGPGRCRAVARIV